MITSIDSDIEIFWNKIWKADFTGTVKEDLFLPATNRLLNSGACQIHHSYIKDLGNA